MSRRSIPPGSFLLTGFIALVGTVFISSPGMVQAGSNPPRTGKVAWKRTVVDKVFRSEGVAVADVNKDGKTDIIVGDVWYEAPAWKMHSLRKQSTKDHAWNPRGYSECFGVFSDDINKDGYPDAIVVPFPGKPCYWYENPQGKPGLWKEHMVATSGCNETPIYVDLFGKGQRVLVMGWQPGKASNMGEMCYFLPGKNPTKLWERHSISGPSQKGKEIPATQRFSHGLGHGDINGDGRADVLCTEGWWEQPADLSQEPWKFHPTKIGSRCADMFAYDIDGDGLNDVLSTSAHNTGMWWHQQKKDGSFLQRDLFPNPLSLAKIPDSLKFNPAERRVYGAIGKKRLEQLRVPWRLNAKLCAIARAQAEGKASADLPAGKLVFQVDAGSSNEIIKKINALLEESKDARQINTPAIEVGVGADGDGKCAVVAANFGAFALFGQSHALHFVDMDGDGLKDLVTGRRYWAHGPKGDDFPADPAFLYWFQAKKVKGVTTFIPHKIDDDSGVATQFAVEDINGDGIPDVIISNKKGVYIFEQLRVASASPQPGTKE